MFFYQSKYVKEMLKKFGLEDSKPTKMSISTEIKLTKDDEADSMDSSKYRGGHSGVIVTFQNLKAMVYWKGYLQPLPIPPTIWSSISMDFIEGLPSSQGKTVNFVVMDRLSKYAHFMTLHHPFTASTVAQVFMDNVFKLHGLPHSIISDKDKSDGQTEVVNSCLECYLRCLTGDKPKNGCSGCHWLSIASQESTMRKAVYNKLSSKYYGPFQIVKRIGQVAYELALPATSQIHNVFHVSQLKKCTHSVIAASGALPAIDSDGLLIKTPIAILDKKLGKVKNSLVMRTKLPLSPDPTDIMPSHKSFMIKKKLAKKMRQNRPIPHWIRMRTDNTIRYNAKRRHWRRTKLGF
nr:Ty3/gypsy retrotransposon protein [Tanacetum cinerariifolium]